MIYIYIQQQLAIEIMSSNYLSFELNSLIAILLQDMDIEKNQELQVNYS